MQQYSYIATPQKLIIKMINQQTIQFQTYSISSGFLKAAAKQFDAQQQQKNKVSKTYRPCNIKFQQMLLSFPLQKQIYQQNCRKTSRSFRLNLQPQYKSVRLKENQDYSCQKASQRANKNSIQQTSINKNKYQKYVLTDMKQRSQWKNKGRSQDSSINSQTNKKRQENIFNKTLNLYQGNKSKQMTENIRLRNLTNKFDKNKHSTTANKLMYLLQVRNRNKSKQLKARKKKQDLNRYKINWHTHKSKNTSSIVQSQNITDLRETKAVFLKSQNSSRTSSKRQLQRQFNYFKRRRPSLDIVQTPSNLISPWQFDIEEPSC